MNLLKLAFIVLFIVISTGSGFWLLSRTNKRNKERDALAPDASRDRARRIVQNVGSLSLTLVQLVSGGILIFSWIGCLAEIMSNQFDVSRFVQVALLYTASLVVAEWVTGIRDAAERDRMGG